MNRYYKAQYFWAAWVDTGHPAGWYDEGSGPCPDKKCDPKRAQKDWRFVPVDPYAELTNETISGFRRKLIEREYGEPFRDVIKGFADDGESMSAVAAILGYSARAFIDLVEREGMREWFPADGRLGCNGVKHKQWVKK